MTRIGNVYGEAMYSLAREEDAAAAVLDELAVLEQCFAQEPDFLHLLASPTLTKEERCAVLDRSLREKVHPYVLNFLKLLTEKGYSRHFHDCCEAYRQHYNLDHGILPVTAVSAMALSQSQKDKLTAKLEALTGKSIQLINRVDPECLGAIRLDYDGKRVDGTVAHRLESVRSMLKNTVL